MKKLLLVVLSLMLTLTLAGTAMGEGLAVGTYDPATAGEVEIGFGWWGNQVRDEVTKAATDYFTENYPNITFNLNTQSWNNYWALMSTYAANNDLPDLMQQDYAYICLLYTSSHAAAAAGRRASSARKQAVRTRISPAAAL